MFNKPKITCLILNYNDYETTVRLMKEIMSYECFDNIVVVDNYSTNESFSELFKYNNGNIHIIQTKKNGGYGYGNNYGINWIEKNLGSKYILLCNPDVHFPECLVTELCQIAETTGSAIVTSLQKNINGQINYKCAWKVPTAFQYIISKGFFLKKKSNIYYNKEYLINNTYCEVECVSGSFFLLNSRLMRQYGMYDEEMFLYCEETTLGTKLKKNNQKCILLCNHYYIHEHAVSVDKTYGKNLSGWIKKQKVWIDSSLIYLKKYKSINVMEAFLAKAFYYFAVAERYVISNVIRLKRGREKWQ